MLYKDIYIYILSICSHCVSTGHVPTRLHNYVYTALSIVNCPVNFKLVTNAVQDIKSYWRKKVTS